MWYSTKSQDKSVVCQPGGVRGCSLFVCTEINHHYDWHVGGWGCLGDRETQNALHTLTNTEASIQSLCSGFVNTLSFLRSKKNNVILHFALHLLRHICLCLLSDTWYSLLTCAHISLFLAYNPSQTSPSCSPPSLCISALLTLLLISHHFNKLHLGHTSVLCNLFHLGANLQNIERLTVRQTNKHTPRLTQPSLPEL